LLRKTVFLKGLGEPEDYTLAESAFTKAFFYDPDVTEARVLTVMIYLARGERKKAHAEIKTLQEQLSERSAALFRQRHHAPLGRRNMKNP
jgi:thioredoxin-like negative regulator of GroEL